MKTKTGQSIGFDIDYSSVQELVAWLRRNALELIILALTFVSVVSFIYYLANGLGLAYNDARSHLDIGRRVVEGLKPGLAQLGSVWLPLTHVLMIPTIWNDFMWHSGLSGAIQSMVAFVCTGVLIYLYLREMGTGVLARIVGVAIFALNINILYLQSTAMTELLLLATMTAGMYQLLRWFKTDEQNYLIKAAFWVMLSTLVRYDGWFLLFTSFLLVALYTLNRRGYSQAEGTAVLFGTLGVFGVFLWLLWNQLIFKDAFYFAFGPYSAHAQQEQLAQAGILATKGDWFLSAKIYLYALAYNSGAFTLVLSFIGAGALWVSRKIPTNIKIASLALLTPLLFNILALYLGHSVLFIQGLSGDTWFNVRYGVMMLPSIAISVGYLVHFSSRYRWVTVGLLAFVMFFSLYNGDAVAIDDAKVGSSQKNVTEVSSWLWQNVRDEKGFVLISAASHDAIIFSSGLPMKKFIHEGTGAYWEQAIEHPSSWARWIVTRTYSDDDLTYRLIKENTDFKKYELVGHYPFADIYQLEPEFLSTLHTEPTLGNQK